MDPESNTTTDPRAHIMSDSVEELPAGLFHDEPEGAPAPGDKSGSGGEEAVGLDLAEQAADAGEGEEGESEGAEEATGEGEGEAEAATGEDESLNEAPEFWSAEDKAAWATVPPALRPMLHRLDKQRVQFEQEKAREAAQVRKEATEQVQQATGVIEEGAKWWTANGPQFFKAFGDKWASVDWVKLAEEDPARCQALRMQKEHEEGLLRQAHERGQRDIETAKERQKVQIQELRRTEHEKVAAKLPEYFGTTEKATATYKELGEYLFGKGVPADRIEQIHEAPIIEMALYAMRFEKAQKQASTVVNRDKDTGKFTARTAPAKRVQPGPALNRDTGDRNADAARRAAERFKKGGGADMDAAADYARVTNLFG